MTRLGHNTSHGFTLIEIVIALAILSTALFVLIQAHYASLNLYEYSRDATIVNNLMRQAVGMAEVEVLAGNLTGGDEFGRRYPGYKYSFDAQPIGDDPGVMLYDVTVRIEGDETSHEMHLLVYDLGRG